MLTSIAGTERTLRIMGLAGAKRRINEDSDRKSIDVHDKGQLSNWKAPPSFEKGALPI